MIELGKCYKNGAQACVGPIRPYGNVFQDEKGFAYLKDGRSLSLSNTELNPRDLLEVCDCKTTKGTK